MAANTYRPVSERAKAIYGDEPFEAEFTPAEERDQVSGGHLEIVPRPYQVLVNNYVEGEQGSTVDLALSVENEAALIAGGVLKRTTTAADDLEGMNKPALVASAEALGLDTSGTKAELVERIKAAQK